MKTTLRAIVLLFAIAGWALAALSVHVIRTPEKVVVVPKNRLGIVDTYVDVRNWTIAEVEQHPLVTRRLLQTEKTEHIAHVAEDDVLEEALGE
ncbi:MAG: hypothetical protein AAF561_14990 [Planctomycetota bacterium]